MTKQRKGANGLDHFAALESLIQSILADKNRAVIAIDGMAASGKTTLAASLAARFSSSTVFHMDDFTIPLEDRFEGYFDAQLSNADIGRFDREVLSPLLEGKGACYRPYACHPVPGFLAPVTVPANTCLVIVEGAYCLHDRLFDRYDLRVLSLISKNTQRSRILARNGEAQLRRFESTWIPMENRHIESRRLRERCDVVLFTD